MNFCNQSRSNWSLHIRSNLYQHRKKIGNREGDGLLFRSTAHLDPRNHGRQIRTDPEWHLLSRGVGSRPPSACDCDDNDSDGAEGGDTRGSCRLSSCPVSR
jgi:hypothetical protein